MAEQQVQDEEIRCGTFDWVIDNFLDSDIEESPSFQFGRCRSCLRIWEIALSVEPVGDLYIIHVDNLLPFFSSETVYTLSLIDVYGYETITTRLTVSESDKDTSGLLFCKSYLKDYSHNVLPEGALTVRLKWYEADQSGNEEGPTNLLQTLSEDFGRLYESKTDTDFLLRAGEFQIPVHRTVLSTRSEVFAAMFRHDTLENQNGVVDIPDVDATVLSDVLYYIYSGQIRGLATTTAAPMYVVADKYALIELRDACLDFLKSNLTVENVCDTALVAYIHGEIELEAKVVKFFKDKLEEIEETHEWKELLKSHSSLAVKLLRSALMTYKENEKKK